MPFEIDVPVELHESMILLENRVFTPLPLPPNFDLTSSQIPTKNFSRATPRKQIESQDGHFTHSEEQSDTIHHGY
jgi:hypothetical protein